MKFWTAPQLWPGETCFIVCGGPSLRGFDFERLRGRRVIAVNSSVFAVPFADALVFGDGRWWAWNGAAVKKMGFAGLIVTPAQEINEAPVKTMRKGKPPGFHLPADTLAMKNTSAMPAMALANHFGAKTFVFLGLDQQGAKDGTTHHHAPHHIGPRPDCWDRQMEELKLAIHPLRQLGIDVINTSMNSRVTWWPKREIGELL